MRSPHPSPAARAPRQKILFSAVALASSIVGFALLGSSGLPLLHRLERDIARQEAANEALRAENARLERVVRDFSPPVNAAAVERAAREQLGFVKPDEIVFHFQEPALR